MAKRFFDTELWKKDWFLDLPIKHKLLVLFLFENCDCAGIWEFNFRLASFLIGETVSIEDVNFINSKKEQFIIFDDKKLYIKDFIEFQYGKLSYNCKPHLPIIKRLTECGIDFELIDENNLTIKQMRKRLTEAAKKQIYIRDKFECQYCGSKENLEIDHIIPLSKGGTNEDDNLITCCHNCNKLKSDKDFDVFFNENKNLFKNLDRVSKILDRVSNFSETLEEKEKEIEKEKEQEIEQVIEKEKEQEEVKTINFSILKDGKIKSFTIPDTDFDYKKSKTLWEKWGAIILTDRSGQEIKKIREESMYAK